MTREPTNEPEQDKKCKLVYGEIFFLYIVVTIHVLMFSAPITNSLGYFNKVI